MPQTIKNKSLGFSIDIKNTPSNATEYDQLAKKSGRTDWDGACNKDAVEYSLRHHWNSKFRPALAKAIGAESGIERRKDGDVLEAEKLYLEWIYDGASVPKLDVKGKELKDKDGKTITETQIPIVVQDFYNKVAQDVADSLPFAVASAPRVATPSKELMKFAQKMIDAINAGKGTFKGTKAKMEKNNPGLLIPVEDDGTITDENFARALKLQQTRILEEATLGAVV